MNGWTIVVMLFISVCDSSFPRPWSTLFCLKHDSVIEHVKKKHLDFNISVCVAESGTGGWCECKVVRVGCHGVCIKMFYSMDW